MYKKSVIKVITKVGIRIVKKKTQTEMQSLWNKMIINQSCKPVSDNFLL